MNANLAGDYPVEYTCKDKAGNSVTETKTYRVLAEIPAVLANISIASDNARDTSLAKSGDIVTITFDTASWFNSNRSPLMVKMRHLLLMALLVP